MIFQSFVAQLCGAIQNCFRFLTCLMKIVIFIEFWWFVMYFYWFLCIFNDFYVFWSLGDGGDGDGDGRIFLEDPTPINPRRDNISRKGNPSLRYIYIYICLMPTFLEREREIYTRETHIYIYICIYIYIIQAQIYKIMQNDME